MKKPDKRTREQRKADESALIAAACLGTGLILLVAALLLTVASAEERDEPEELAEPAVEAYDPAWDKPATEYAYCDDVFLGEFTLTAYCPDSCCCGKSDGITATGTTATEGRTIAVDPRVIPYGSTVTIYFADGTSHTYTAEDCGGAIKENRIDVFFDDHQAAREFGVQTAYVYVEEAA